MFRLILNRSPMWFNSERKKLSRPDKDSVSFLGVCGKTIITVIIIILKQGIRFSFLLPGFGLTKTYKIPKIVPVLNLWTWQFGFHYYYCVNCSWKSRFELSELKVFRFSSTLNLISKQQNLLSPTIQPYSAVNAFSPERLQVSMHTHQIKAWFQHPTLGPKLQNQPPTSITQPPHLLLHKSFQLRYSFM